jgi:hypothetical protein
MKSRSLKLLIICSIAFVFSHTNAAVVTWSGSGSFTSIGSNLSGIRSVGDSVQFTASYDTSAQSFLTADSLPSFYFKHYGQDANVYIRFTSGELVWEAIGTLNRNISVAQIGYIPSASLDEFFLKGGPRFGTFTGLGASEMAAADGYIRLYIYGFNENFISGFSLPSPNEVNLSLSTGIRGSFFMSGTDSTDFSIDLGTVTIVPEPSSGLLVVLGLSGLLLKRRRTDRPLSRSGC